MIVMTSTYECTSQHRIRKLLTSLQYQGLGFLNIRRISMQVQDTRMFVGLFITGWCFTFQLFLWLFSFHCNYIILFGWIDNVMGQKGIELANGDEFKRGPMVWKFVCNGDISSFVNALDEHNLFWSKQVVESWDEGRSWRMCNISQVMESCHLLSRSMPTWLNLFPPLGIRWQIPSSNFSLWREGVMRSTTTILSSYQISRAYFRLILVKVMII